MDQDGNGFELRGIVRDVASTSFSVEGCATLEAPSLNAAGAGGEGGDGAGGDSPGGAGGMGGDCASTRWTIEAVGPELVIPAETGMHVSVAFASWCQPFSGCNRTMIVRDELADGESTLLATYGASFGGHTGGVTTPLAWPVTLELVDLGCFPPNTGAIRGPIRWALRMAARANATSSVLLNAGQSGELFLDPGSDERWLAHNLASSDVGGFDATTSLYFYLVKRR